MLVSWAARCRYRGKLVSASYELALLLLLMNLLTKDYLYLVDHIFGGEQRAAVLQAPPRAYGCFLVHNAGARVAHRAEASIWKGKVHRTYVLHQKK